MNIILNVAVKLICYNPIYEYYLQEMDVERKGVDNFVIKAIQGIRDSRKSHNSKSFQMQSNSEWQDFNKIIYMDSILLSAQKD